MVSNPIHTHIRRLFLLRFLLVGGCTLLLLWVHFALHISLPLFEMLAILTGTLLINATLGARLYWNNWEVESSDLFIQLLWDCLALALLLYLADGARNPFVSLFLFPLIVAAATLPARFSWSLAAITGLFYSVLFIWYQPLPALAEDITRAFWLHQVGMWMNFLMSAGMIAFVVTKMGADLRARDLALNQLREESLRQEQIVALGTFAAGAAHELGTPLATIAVLSHELKSSQPQDTDWQADLELIQQQTQQCKHLLGKLVDQAQALKPQKQNWQAFIQKLLDRWLLLHPQLQAQIQQTTSAPITLSPPPTLEQALLNLLNNSADASAQTTHRVQVQIKHTENKTEITLLDEGTGIAQHTLAKLGHSIGSQKQDGMGIGLFLANATIEKLGGSVQLFNRPEGGVRTEITIPFNLMRP